MKSTHRTDKWASGIIHHRKYGPNENIRGGELLIKIDMRFGMPQIVVYAHGLTGRRFPEVFLGRLKAFLEIEGWTTPYYAEKIVERIRKDIEKLKK